MIFSIPLCFYVSLFFVLGFFYSDNAHAYIIDPNTGTMLFQMLIAGMATGLVFFKSKFGKVYHWVKSKANKEKNI
jgi:drug/metabolite transporter (DMT)-like permease